MYRHGDHVTSLTQTVIYYTTITVIYYRCAPICANKVRNDPAVPTKAIASQGSRHVHARQVFNTPAYLPLSYLFASAKLIFKTDCTN